jgi:hypothetical protein
MVQSDFAVWTSGWDLNLWCGLQSEGVGSDSALWATRCSLTLRHALNFMVWLCVVNVAKFSQRRDPVLIWIPFIWFTAGLGVQISWGKICHDFHNIQSGFRIKVQNMITFLDIYFKVMTLRLKLIARLSYLIYYFTNFLLQHKKNFIYFLKDM